MADSLRKPALSDWPTPPPDLPPLEANVHVWRAFLDTGRAQLQVLEAMLSDDERERASRFAFADDRDRFVSARGILRVILSRYLGRPASTIEFTYERAGKPRLRATEADPPICFNVSHSECLAAYAFSRDRGVGVDVEAIRLDRGNERIADRFFSARELAELGSLPPERRGEAFFWGWTRKEAYVKATGAGLSTPFDSFDVSLEPAGTQQLVTSDGGCWTLRSFLPADGYAGAVVAEGKEWQPRLFSFTSSAARF
jgi:4'-phosphopantetheinyl transferase